jgi:hypothetical protein
MSKELESLELFSAIVEYPATDTTKLDDLSLAIVGGGEAAIAF